MSPIYFNAGIVFLGAGILTAFFVLLVRKFALTRKIVDAPNCPRKIHKQNVPLLGGLAVFAGFYLILAGAYFWLPQVFEKISVKVFLGMFLASVVLMIGGYLDDKYDLSPVKQIMFPVIAALIAVVSGIGVFKITNPLGGVFVLGPILAYVVAFVWLLAMMYTTKLLDGLDGLATGIATIGAVMIFALTQTQKFFQPDVGLIAAIFAGACVGFLIFNFHPAKIFLGEGGSVFVGFILGVLAIISGSKIATTLLVVGIPALDVLWVVIYRTVKRKSLIKGDSAHLHYRLLKKGLSHKFVVLLMYLLAIGFGVTTLFLQSKQKLIALAILVLVMIVLGIYLVCDFSFIKQKQNQ